MTITGTSYFVNRDAAIAYYKPYHFDSVLAAVARKLADGEIHIGKPPLKKGQRITVIDDGLRYAIEESPAESIFYFEFIGRLNGAIGITYPQNKEVRAENYEAAVLKLYDTHEHISIAYHNEWKA